LFVLSRLAGRWLLAFPALDLSEKEQDSQRFFGEIKLFLSS
jgi:hypothetical protein